MIYCYRRDRVCERRLDSAHRGRRPEPVVLCDGTTVVTAPVVLAVVSLLVSSLPPPRLLRLRRHQLIKRKGRKKGIKKKEKDVNERTK